MNPQYWGGIRLISACARDRGDDLLWREFLRHYGPKIKHLVRRTCLLWSAETGLYPDALPPAIEESDLFQSVILRLVKDDCAVMSAFWGSTEAEWLTYLAVTTRSVVRDQLRSQGRQKRSSSATPFAQAWHASVTHKRNQHLEMEKNLLAGELRTICARTIRNSAGEHTARDILAFELYFFHDASMAEIATCKAVNLTAEGVKKVLYRLRRRVRKVIEKNRPQIGDSQSGRGKAAKIVVRRREREATVKMTV